MVWDPWRDGATKVFASAGRFSYALPTVAVAASFGGLTQLVTYNFDPVSVVQDPNVIGHGKMVVEGTGTYSTPRDAGLKASYQDELVVGIERMLAPGLTVGLKGTYRSLNQAMEDRCDFDPTSPDTDYSSCALVNPGSNAKFASGAAPTCNGLFDVEDAYQCYPAGPPTPKVSRIYRGIEVVARQSIGDRFWLQASYIYSSLRGNYDGGVNQAVYGQTSPGINSDFDYPALWHNGYGVLALDRPNSFRLDGYWTMPWNLSIGLQGFVETGAPLNKMGFFNSNYGPLVFLEPRGSVGRLPALWEANLTLSYPIVLGPVTAIVQGYVFNVFNNQIATSRDDSWSISPPAGFPATIYDPNQEQNNPYYGSVTGRSAPRSFRAALRISF